MKTRNTKPKQKISVALASPKQAGRYGRKPEITDTRGSEKMEIDYFRFFESLYRKEVTDWLEARGARRNPFHPLTYPMQQLYKDAMLDNHLQGAIENRILRVLNKEMVFKDKEGSINPERSSWIQTRWFKHIVRKAMESKFFGYSIVLITEYSAGKINKLVDIPRENIIPEKGLLLKNALNTTGESILYNQFPNFFIYLQLLPESIGILERVAPMTIFKRHSWASWDEFEQIFGMPIRIARTMINTQTHKDELQEWLELMGTASYGIFDKQTEIDIKENQKNDAYNVYLQKITAINKEISKGIVGQTMTMDDGSSQSQANVHLQVYDEITKADISDIQDWATDDFIPVMRAHGYDIPEGYYVQLVEKEIIKPLDKIKIDQVLLQSGFNLKPEYIEEFYGTPLDEDEPRRAAQPGIDTQSNSFI